MSVQEQNECRERGLRDYRDGLSRDDCPYIDEEEIECWLKGFRYFGIDSGESFLTKKDH